MGTPQEQLAAIISNHILNARPAMSTDVAGEWAYGLACTVHLIPQLDADILRHLQRHHSWTDALDAVQHTFDASREGYWVMQALIDATRQSNANEPTREQCATCVKFSEYNKGEPREANNCGTWLGNNGSCPNDKPQQPEVGKGERG